MACFAGSVRIVDGASSCTKFETFIQWNQRGPAGPKGDTGAQGPKGDTGAAGANGAQAILIGGQALTSGQAQAFLDIPAIKGESTDAKPAGDIDILSFSFGVMNSASIGTGGNIGAGKATFSTFHFNKLYDASSPKLLEDAITGAVIPEVTFAFDRPGSSQDFLTIKLDNVLVSSYHQGGTHEPPLLEDVELTAAKGEVSYRPQNADGSLGSTISTQFDLATNKGG